MPMLGKFKRGQPDNTQELAEIPKPSLEPVPAPAPRRKNARDRFFRKVR